jgi:hypothetical protein
VLPAASFAWLLTPFASGVVIGASTRARAAVARHLALCLAVGWAGVAGFVWGSTVLDAPVGVLAFALGGPLAGLSFWGASSRGGEGGDPPEDPPPPDTSEWDWEAFDRALRDYERDRLTPAGGPRARA